jgi:hypothetical protein
MRSDMQRGPSGRVTIKKIKKIKNFKNFKNFLIFFVSTRQLMVSRWSENQVLSSDARQSIKKMKKP